MVQVKFGDNYLAHYLSWQHKLKRTFNILILIFSGSGVLGWEIWKPIAWIALVIIGTFQLLSLIQNQLIRSNEEVLKIAKLRTRYTKYFNKLEKLWLDLDSREMTDNEAKTQFFVLRRTEQEKIEALDNRIGVKRWKKLCEKADVETREYFNTYHSN